MTRLVRLSPYLRPHMPHLAAALAIVAAVVAVDLIPPYLSKLMVDRYFCPPPGGNPASWLDAWLPLPSPGLEWAQAFTAGLSAVVCLNLALLAFRLLLNFLKTGLLDGIGNRSLHAFRVLLFQHLQRLPLAYHDERPGGDTLARLSSDVEDMTELFRGTLVGMLQDFLMIAGLAVILVGLDWRLALALAAIIIGPVSASLWLRAQVRDAVRLERETWTEMRAHLQERLNGLREVKLFNREMREKQEYSLLSDRLRAAELSSLGPGARFAFCADLAGSLCVLCILAYGGSMVLTSSLSVGSMIAALIYFQCLYPPLHSFCWRVGGLQFLAVAAERVLALVDTPPEDTGPGLFAPFPNSGTIEFDGVWFCYREGEWVLQDLSFVLQPGQSLALVGPTGAGKSTIVSLLLRFYEPTRGTIRWNGVDLRRLDPRELRRRAGVVFQDSQLFSGTVAQNIGFAAATTAQSIGHAAHLVGATELIEGMPLGFDTPLLEGLGLAAGERQLLAFARALAHEPEWLLLDESTSCLDAVAEERLLSRLTPLLRSSTCVLVAHRLNTVEWVDQILVLDNGRLVERGRHSELLRADSLYARLYLRQSRGDG